jgi:hypothetical protein
LDDKTQQHMNHTQFFENEDGTMTVATFDNQMNVVRTVKIDPKKTVATHTGGVGGGKNNVAILNASKPLLVIAMLFFSLLSASAQDTTFTTTVNGQLYQVNRIVTTDGFTDSYKLFTDTAELVRQISDRFIRESQTFAEAAKTLQEADRTISLFNKLDLDAQGSYGRSPLTAVSQQYDYEFLAGSWQQEVNGTPTAVTWARLSSTGRIRFTPQGSTARTCLLFGNMMRVVNWPVDGTTTNLYRVRDGLWSDANRKIFLRKL